MDKVYYKNLDYKCSSKQNQSKGKSDVHDDELPYIGNLSKFSELSKFSKEICKENFNIKLVFNSFKIKNYFQYKHPISDNLKSLLVYEFTCASCSFSCIGETLSSFQQG